MTLGVRGRASSLAQLEAPEIAAVEPNRYLEAWDATRRAFPVNHTV
jgi:hypothetical protein